MARVKLAKKKHIPYCLYMLCINTGHFYIGATSNPGMRHQRHLGLIINLVHDLKTHDQMHWHKKKKPDFKQTRGHKVHMFFAEKIKPQVNHYLTPKKIIGWYYSFKIIKTANTPDDLRKMENNYLRRHKNNPLCLNECFVSSYSKSKQ